MSDNQSMELMHEILKKINSNHTDLKQEIVLVKERLSSMDDHLAGFHRGISTHYSEIEFLKDRIEQIEKKLGLIDGGVF